MNVLMRAPIDGSEPARPRARSLEGVLADLASTLATAPADAVGDTITEILRHVSARLELDWAVLLTQEGAGSRPCTLHHACLDRPPAPASLLHLLECRSVASTLRAGLPAWCSQFGDLDADAADDPWLSEVRSVALVPVMPATATGSRLMLVIGSSTREYRWTTGTVDQLRMLAALISQALVRKIDHEPSRRAPELQARPSHGAPRALSSRPKLRPRPSWELLASESPAVRHALAKLEQVAATSATVLLLGETGVGKERFARAIHELSARGERDMVAVNCTAIPDTLIESELFGRERGAYTGALTRQAGRFEAANGSTLFLDEIGELSAEVQAKLLRVLEARVIQRLGSTQETRVDVRIVAATHRNLDEAVAARTFRDDLFYRLNVFPIHIPPLRERVEDIPVLAWRFVDEFSNTIGKSIHSISNESMQQLLAYSWPGNVRELRNLIERAMILGNGPVLTIEVPRAAAVHAAPGSMSMKDVEIAHIRAVLQSTSWRIRGKGGAAEQLELKASTLETRMAKFGITRPKAG